MYNQIYTILSSQFELKKGNKKNYFYDKDGQVVATVDKKSITMYYDFPECSHEIWNHKGKVVVTFVRDFNVNGKICDIFFVDGLCGACNDVEVHEDYSIDTTANNELCDNQLQQMFNILNPAKKIEVFEAITGCKATGANLENACLFDSNEKLGNCGTITSSNGLASFDICGLIHVKNCYVAQYIGPERSQNYDEKHINIVHESGEKTYTDYRSIYLYYRKKHNWYYTDGYNCAGSCNTRAYVCRKQSQTVDDEAIHKDLKISLPVISEEMINQIFDSYPKRSLNSIRLQIIREINDYLASFKANNNRSEYIKMYAYVNKLLNRYNFNQRKVDIARKNGKVKKLKKFENTK